MSNPKDSFARISLLAKRILIHAYGHSTKGTIPDRIIAIHDIHNAVEWLLVAIHDFYAPQITLPIGFKDLFDHANDLVKSHTGNSLPLKKDIMRLTDARNNAQHRAYPPSIEELQAHVTLSESFFRAALEAMNIGVLYDDLSLADLLSDDFVLKRNLHEPIYDGEDNLIKVQEFFEEIKVVEQVRRAEFFSKDLRRAHHAFSELHDLLILAESEIAETMAEQRPNPGVSISTNHYGGLSSIANLMKLSADFSRLFNIEFKSPLSKDGAIRQFYESISTILLRMSIGVDIAEYHRFEWLYHKQRTEEDIEISQNDIQWALNFAVDTLLLYQSFLHEQRSLKRGIL